MNAMSVGDLQSAGARQCKCKGYPEHGVVRGGDVTGLTAHSLLGTRAPPLPPSRHLGHPLDMSAAPPPPKWPHCTLGKHQEEKLHESQ